MENRCDSVDALMYAYYAYREFMRTKEENQMLEKNKDYLEMRVSSADYAFTQNGPAQISVDGYIDTTYMDVPDLGKFYILISKEKFEKLQQENKDLQDANEAEKDYISERDKAEALQTENEQLKKKLHEFDPIPDYKELLEKLYSKDDVEKLEWTLNHICGGQASVNGWMVTARLWKRCYEDLFKLVGFSSKEEVEDYLVNEAECDTLHEAISKLKDQVKYTCDEWCSANSSNNSWKAAAECNSPKELIEKLNLLRDDISGRSTVIEHRQRDIEKWQKATGFSTPEGFLSATINDPYNPWRDATCCNSPLEANLLINEYKDIIQKWKEATGCETPDKARIFIADLTDSKETTIYLGDTFNVIARWQKVTGYNKPKDFLKWKANIEGIMEAWQTETGCKYPAEARILLEKWKVMTKCETPEAAATWITSYEKACERGNELAEKVEEWKKATGCNISEEASKKLKYYENRLDSAKESASYAIRHLDNIVFRDDKRTDWSDK